MLGPETEADSAAWAASAQAVGTMDPAHLDTVALHVHHRDIFTLICLLLEEGAQFSLKYYFIFSKMHVVDHIKPIMYESLLKSKQGPTADVFCSQ